MFVNKYPKQYLYRRLVEAKLYMDIHFAEDLDLDNISDEAYFSKYHFIRQFKKIYGKTPHQYLIVVRIEKAMQLLQAGVSVSEACYSVGFQSLSSFSGLFKRIARITPSQYLLRHQKLKAQIINSPLEFVPGCFADAQGLKRKAILEK